VTDDELAALIGMRPDEDQHTALRRYVREVEDSCGSTLSRAVAAEQELRRLRRIIKRMRDLLKDARGR
jgi:hypothetical protein